MEVVDIGILRPATLFVEDMLVQVDLGNKIPAPITLAIGEQALMLKEEVDIGIRPSTIPTITNATVVDF